MIPLMDVVEMVADLNRWGWKDYKIEVCCGLGAGYVAQVRCGNIKQPSAGKMVAVFNFWEVEALLHGADLPKYGTLKPDELSFLQTRVQSETST